MTQQAQTRPGLLPRLTSSETQALQVLSRLPIGGTIAHVRTQLLSAVPYTTLASTLHQTVRKGYAQREKRGRQYWFSAGLPGEAYGHAQITQLVLRDFAGSYPALIAFCIRLGYLSFAEVEAIVSSEVSC